MPARVLQVFNHYLEPGGEEIWVNKMRELVAGEVDLHDLRFHSRAWKGCGAPSFLWQARSLWSNPYARNRLRQEVAVLSPEALIFHNVIPVGSLGLYDEAAKIGLPVIQYVHNFRPFSVSGTLWCRDRVDDRAVRGNVWPEILARVWERSYLKTALLSFYLYRLRSEGIIDRVASWIAVSEFMRSKFMEAGVPAGRIHTLRHCWNARAEAPAVPEGGYYLFLGRLVVEKGALLLLDSWARLERELGAGCPELVIAGTGPDEELVRSRCRNLKKVRCVGFVDGAAKDELISGCRGLLAPSIWWEPLGLIVYEAYEVSRPVIAARSGGLSETVVHGSTGLLHPPGSADAVAEAVMELEGMGRDGRIEMGRAGRQWLLANASPHLWRERFRTILDDTITSTNNQHRQP